MCQVLPFTLPCCRRVYVEVTKLPSCPNAWPEKKCPPELCIQVRDYEPEDREAGTCWRCQAVITGVLGDERQNLRPAIDRAMIVHGLDEVGVSGRRRMVEEGGKCWYCGAKAGCEYCDVAIKAEAGVSDDKPESSGKKRRRDLSHRKENAVNKRIKFEPRDNDSQPPTFLYPDPEHPSQWPNVFPRPYNNMPLFPGGYEIVQGSSQTGFGLPWSNFFSPQASVPGTSAKWASVHEEQNRGQIGFENGRGKEFASQGPAGGPQGDSFFNKVAYRSQFAPDTCPASEVKPRIQPEVYFENPARQMDDATLAQLLDKYDNKTSNNVGYNISHESPQLGVTIPSNDTNKEGTCSQVASKTDQPLPAT